MTQTGGRRGLWIKVNKSERAGRDAGNQRHLLSHRTYDLTARIGKIADGCLTATTGTPKPLLVDRFAPACLGSIFQAVECGYQTIGRWTAFWQRAVGSAQRNTIRPLHGVPCPLCVKSRHLEWHLIAKTASPWPNRHMHLLPQSWRVRCAHLRAQSKGRLQRRGSYWSVAYGRPMPRCVLHARRCH